MDAAGRRPITYTRSECLLAHHCFTKLIYAVTWNTFFARSIQTVVICMVTPFA